ncbi:hypothetical protein [Streptomyces mirabilis]|uniref:hypothetical protein n=1 Tax=Streptomyces mirabilis TaxID=68239 RepID=UPI0033DD335C
MTTRVDIRFEFPAPSIPLPPETREAFVAALRARPGAWALMGQHSSPGAARQTAYSIRRAVRTRCFRPAGAFEAEAKSVMGEHRVYVRYVGQDAARASSEVTAR